MNRHKFLKTLGISGAAILATYCLGGCRAEDPKPINDPSKSGSDSKVDFTLNLNADENKHLLVDGGFVVKNRVVVARTIKSEFVAVTQVCSHQGNVRVSYSKNTNEFFCDVHGARFSTEGKGLNSLGSAGLKTYKTLLSGNELRVYES